MFTTSLVAPAAPATGDQWLDQAVKLLKTWDGAAWRWAAAGGGGGGAVTRAGGNTTEATTTSTSAVDLLASSALSIATNVPIWFVVAMRKTAAAFSVALGLKLNATVVGEALGGGGNLAATNATDVAQSRYASCWLSPRITNYNLTSSGLALSSGLAGTSISVGYSPTASDAQPIATITDVIIRGITSDASITLGADELHVMTLAVS